MTGSDRQSSADGVTADPGHGEYILIVFDFATTSVLSLLGIILAALAVQLIADGVLAFWPATSRCAASSSGTPGDPVHTSTIRHVG